MALKLYNVTIGGIDHTMQLDEAEARRLGVLDQPAGDTPKKGRAPRNKAKAPEADKADGPEADKADDSEW